MTNQQATEALQPALEDLANQAAAFMESARYMLFGELMQARQIAFALRSRVSPPIAPVVDETSASLCPACGKADCFDHQLRMKVDAASGVIAERQRLEREALEILKRWATLRFQPHFGGMVALENEMQAAASALLEFESKNGK